MDKIFKNNSKTFSFASLFFPRNINNEITKIYPFFRFSDDLSDNPINNPEFNATIKFGKLLNKFKSDKQCEKWLERNMCDKIVREAYFNYFRYCKKFNVPPKYIEFIFKGYLMDQKMDLSKNHQIESMDDLIRYSFYVAGSIAIILSFTINDEYSLDATALSQLSAIAIGYQLTNISRDIITDAKMKRCYIPWVNTNHRNKLFKGSLDNSIILKYSKEVIELADVYYKYGIPILSKLPNKVARGLKISTRVYREIGMKIYNINIYPTRMYTTKLEKIMLLIKIKNKPFVSKGKMPINPIIFINNNNYFS
jgi:phytoene synthase